MDKANRIAKLTNILNECRSNLNALHVSGVKNCGYVFATDQNIRFVIEDLAKMAEEDVQDKEDEGEDGSQCDEIQADA